MASEMIGTLTPDDNILESAGNCAVAVLVEDGLVAGMEPQDTLLVAYHALVRLFWVIPVAALQLIAGHAQLTTLANGQNSAVTVHDLRVGVGQNRADGGQPAVHRVVRVRVEASRRGFSEA